MMESAGVRIDHYTVSIMLKSSKRAKSSNSVARALGVLDRSGLEPWTDEIMFNTVLETCSRHREFQRLGTLLDRYIASGRRLLPSAPTYASLIKACGALSRVDDCHRMWDELVVTRGMEPSDIVMGCMLDALVCNDRADEAMDLYTKWKSKVAPSPVILVTLLKGLAAGHQADRAIALWLEMRAEGVPVSTVAYNAVIDSQARTGAMDKVSELFEEMTMDNCQPDTITFSTIIKGYCVQGELEKAMDVFSSARSNGWFSSKDDVVYNTILAGCVRCCRMDLAGKILDEMNNDSVEATNFTL